MAHDVCIEMSVVSKDLLYPLLSSRCSSALSKRLCRSGEEVNSESAESATLQLPTDSADRSQNVWQWIMESDRQAKHKPHRYTCHPENPFDPTMIAFTFNNHSIITRFHSTQSTRKLYGSESARTHTWGGAGISGHLRTHQPAHPFIQDPAMPPLPPPNTLAQLEEACRRLEEVSKPPKQR